MAIIFSIEVCRLERKTRGLNRDPLIGQQKCLAGLTQLDLLIF